MECGYIFLKYLWILDLRMRRDNVSTPDMMHVYLEWLDNDVFFWISVLTGTLYAMCGGKRIQRMQYGVRILR